MQWRSSSKKCPFLGTKLKDIKDNLQNVFKVYSEALKTTGVATLAYQNTVNAFEDLMRCKRSYPNLALGEHSHRVDINLNTGMATMTSTSDGSDNDDDNDSTSNAVVAFPESAMSTTTYMVQGTELLGPIENTQDYQQLHSQAAQGLQDVNTLIHT